MPRLDRRGFLGLAGASLGGVAVGVGADRALGAGSDSTQAGAAREPFHGEHQAGIVTPVQDRLHIAAFDVADGVSRDELRDLMQTWSQAAERMTEGRQVGEPAGSIAPPEDTGEADGLPAARLTVTFGLGPTLFEKDSHDRFGIRRRRPPELRPLGPLPGDELDADRSGGDLCVQACADDPQVAFHAVRNLARLGRGTVTMRWSQLGFGKTSKTSTANATPRNLMGFKDGTRNITLEDKEALNRHVWVRHPREPWMRGGTFMVTRRIRMLIEVWDRNSLADQEQTIGRHKDSGAPLGGRAEDDKPNLGAMPDDAHVRLASSDLNDGVRILRRGYSFTDGYDSELGQLDAGLFFIAFQRDPHRQFAALQRRLGRLDALNEYIKHTSSAVFAVPGGMQAGSFVAEQLWS